MAEDKTTFLVIVGVGIVAIAGLLLLISGSWPAISGYGTTASGPLNVTIQGTLSVKLADSSANFGSGYVDPAQTAAYVDSNGTYVNWINTTTFIADPMILENDGQVVANVSIADDKNASALIGGTNSALKYYTAENESSGTSCTVGQITAHTNLTTSASQICDKLLYSDATDSLKIYYDLKIPNDAVQGNKTTSITFTASASV